MSSHIEQTELGLSDCKISAKLKIQSSAAGRIDWCLLNYIDSIKLTNSIKLFDRLGRVYRQRENVTLDELRWQQSN